MRHALTFALVLSALNLGAPARAQNAFLSDSTLNGWTILNTGTTATFGTISTQGKDTVWVGGEDNYRTTDAGRTWGHYLTAPERINAFFIDDTTGFGETNTANFYKTTDGGLTWGKRVHGAQHVINHFFLNNRQGWLLGNAEVSGTTDAGESWFNVKLNTFPNAIVFSDSLRGIAMGEVTNYQGQINGPRGACIETTTDGGRTWSANVVSFQKAVTDIALVGGNVVVAVGDRGLVARSTNWGSTWDTTGTEDGINAYLSVSFCGQSGYAVGPNGLIVKSTDGGISWTHQTAPVLGTFVTVRCLDTSTAYILAAHMILKTTNGGLAWVPGTSSTPESSEVASLGDGRYSISYTLSQSQPIRCTVYDMNGRVIRTEPETTVQSPGAHMVTVDLRAVPSGAYTYALQGRNAIFTGKLLKP